MNVHSQQEQQQRDEQQNESTNIYLTDNSTLQTPEEERLDKNKDNRHGEDGMETNTTEDVDIDKLAGSDRAGTNERKP
jgi:hypothetical protein